MTTQTNSRLVSSFRYLSYASSTTVILVGCLVLVGWILDIATLKSVLPTLVTMEANTAVVFILAGVATMIVGVYAEAAVGIARPRADSLAPLSSVLRAGRQTLMWGITGEMVAVLDLEAPARNRRIVVSEELEG